jgi:hypothetical protein
MTSRGVPLGAPIPTHPPILRPGTKSYTVGRSGSPSRELTRRTRGKSLAQMIEELARYLTGWRAYFGFCESPSVLRKLDQWTRRRLRAVAWKQWKRGRTRFAELTRRGVGPGLGGANRRQPARPVAAQQQPRLDPRFPQPRLRRARPAFPRRPRVAQFAEPPYTDPYVRWCGRGGAVRRPPIPIDTLPCASRHRLQDKPRMHDGRDNEHRKEQEREDVAQS